MSSRGVDRLTPSVTRQNRRCINCSFLIPRNLPTHSLEQASTPMINLLQSWITLNQLSSECMLCTECLTLLQDRANTIIDGSLSLPAFGHRRLCFSCGNSILRATRTYPVRQDRQERNILIRNVPLHLISRLERVCAACWRSATREVQRRNLHNSNRPGLPEAILPDAGSSGDLNIPEPPPLPQQNLHPAQSDRTDEESSVRLPAEDDDEIIVFCPKCDTEVSHTADGIQKLPTTSRSLYSNDNEPSETTTPEDDVNNTENIAISEDLNEDQTKIIIAKVYHYFEQEYEELKNTYDGLDLTPLSKFRQRTALATGVSESTVCEILQEEERRRNAEEPHKPLRVPRKARKRSRQTDNSNEEDDFESDDDGDDEEQPSTDHATETLVVKEEPLETFNEEPENATELVDVKDEPDVSGAHEELADPLVADVKTEPRNEEASNTKETRAVQPASKRYKGSTRGRNEEASPSPSAPLGSSAPPGTSTPPGPPAPPATRKRELLLLEDGEVKLKDIEIGEEGFS